MKTPSALRLPGLLALGCLSLLLTAGATAPPTPGRVVFTDGEVTANGLVIDTGDLLPAVVTLKTGPASVVEVVFGGRNVFRLGPNAVAKVDFAALKKTVVLDRGAFTSVLKQLAQVAGDPSFTLKTPTVNAGVRGTSFHVEATESRTYFCTCNGSVDLDDGVAADRVTTANAHHGAKIYQRAEDGSLTVTEGGLEGHGDASLETLASWIGVSLDWSRPDLRQP